MLVLVRTGAETKKRVSFHLSACALNVTWMRVDARICG